METEQINYAQIAEIVGVTKEEIDVLLDIMSKKLGPTYSIEFQAVENKYLISYYDNSYTEKPVVHREILNRNVYIGMFNEFSREYKVEKIIRSCDKSISHNYNTHKVSTTLSTTVDGYKTAEEIKEIGKEVYKQCEEMTLDEIKEIQLALASTQGK